MRLHSSSPGSKLRIPPRASFQKSTGETWRSQNGRVGDTRLLYVAAETGARFVRERIGLDPLDWLFSKLDLFDGRTALESCRDPDGFRRAAVLHGLSLGLDVEPRIIEGLPAHEFLSSAARALLFPREPHNFDDGEPLRRRPVALYTCSISAELGYEHVQVFCAMIAGGPLEVRDRLRRRYGPLLEDEAQVRAGFDWSEPLACAMVSEAMAHVLSIAAAHPTSSFAQGLDFQVEQRFAA